MAKLLDATLGDLEDAFEFASMRLGRQLFAEKIHESIDSRGYWVDEDREVLLHEPSHPGCAWRITHFASGVPTGHVEFRNLDEAIREASVLARWERKKSNALARSLVRSRAILAEHHARYVEDS